MAHLYSTFYLSMHLYTPSFVCLCTTSGQAVSHFLPTCPHLSPTCLTCTPPFIYLCTPIPHLSSVYALPLANLYPTFRPLATHLSPTCLTCTPSVVYLCTCIPHLLSVSALPMANLYPTFRPPVPLSVTHLSPAQISYLVVLPFAKALRQTHHVDCHSAIHSVMRQIGRSLRCGCK